MLYLLQVNVGLILFYALYKLVCTRDTFFRSRRFILIVSLVLPFILPFIDVREWLESRDRMIMLTHFDYSACCRRLWWAVKRQKPETVYSCCLNG